MTAKDPGKDDGCCALTNTTETATYREKFAREAAIRVAAAYLTATPTADGDSYRWYDADAGREVEADAADLGAVGEALLAGHDPSEAIAAMCIETVPVVTYTVDADTVDMVCDDDDLDVLDARTGSRRATIRVVVDAIADAIEAHIGDDGQVERHYDSSLRSDDGHPEVWDAVLIGRADELRAAIGLVDDEQIEALQSEAAAHGDEAQVAVCARALNGADDARAECARVIADAAREEDLNDEAYGVCVVCAEGGQDTPATTTEPELACLDDGTGYIRSGPPIALCDECAAMSRHYPLRVLRRPCVLRARRGPRCCPTRRCSVDPCCTGGSSGRG